MVMFHSYVCLPEGIGCQFQLDWSGLNGFKQTSINQQDLWYSTSINQPMYYIYGNYPKIHYITWIFDIGTGILDYLREDFLWLALPFQHTDSKYENNHLNIRTEPLNIHFESFWSIPTWIIYGYSHRSVWNNFGIFHTLHAGITTKYDPYIII